MAIDIDQSFYNTGTASVENGGTVVTGQGTQWISSIRANDIFGTHKGDGVRILSVESNTSLTLAYPWTGETQATAPYEVQFTPYDTGYYPAVRQLLQTMASGNVEAFASLTGEANKVPIFTGPGAMTLVDISEISQVGIKTYADAYGTNIPDDVNYISLKGYSTPGDGGQWPLAKQVDNTGTLQRWQVQTNTGSKRWQIADGIEISPLMLGAPKDGTTTADVFINDAVSFAQSRGQKTIDGGGFNYRVTGRNSVSNKYGVEFKNMNLIYNVTGGTTQANTYSDKNKTHFGIEYLWSLYNKIKLVNTEIRVYAYGDSTMLGPSGWDFGAGTTPYEAFWQSMWPRLAQDFGLRNKLTATNRGVGGQAVSGMDFAADLAAGMDLMLIKYGINDATTSTDLKTALETFANSLDAKLAQVRASTNGSVDKLPIILMGPSSTYQPTSNRDAKWFEQVRTIYVNAARKHRCFYFDTYAEFQDSTWAVNQWLDADGLHPEGAMYFQIFGRLFNVVFNRDGLSFYRRNNFWSMSGVNRVPLSSWNQNAEYYTYGISIDRATVGNGFPVTGALRTFTQADGRMIQELWQENGIPRVMTRTINVSSNTQGEWTGVEKSVDLNNGWGIFSAADWGNPSVVRHDDGVCTVRLNLSIGTTTAGTTIATIPAGYRPKANIRVLATDINGSVCSIELTTAGTVILRSGTPVTILCVNTTYIAQTS